MGDNLGWSVFLMSGELEFSWAEHTDLGEIQAFITGAFGLRSFQADASRIRWLYFDNPYGVHVALCRHAGKLVAICPHVPQLVRLGNREIQAGFGVDFFVQPAWRRRGIGKRFLDMRLDRFKLSLSTGQSAEMYALYQKLGARDLGPFLMGYHRKAPPGVGSPRRFIRGWLAWARGIRASGNFEKLETHSGRLAKPVPGINEWQRWRFGIKSPYQDHTFFVDPRDGGSVGAICRQNNEIEHILALASETTDRLQLLRGIVQSLPSSEVRILFCGKALNRDCHQAGFLVRPRANRLLAISKDAGLSSRLSPGCIELLAESSDTDLMRHKPAAPSGTTSPSRK